MIRSGFLHRQICLADAGATNTMIVDSQLNSARMIKGVNVQKKKKNMPDRKNVA